MPLFLRYPAPPDEIVGCAAALVVASTHVDHVNSDVQKQAADAQAAVEGTLVVPLATAPQTVGEHADAVALLARYSAAVLTQFAAAVSTYDGGVDDLNRRREAAMAGSDAMSAGKAALLAQLTAAHGGLEAALDAAAARAAGMLDRGPNATDIAGLTAAGVMPTATPVNDPAVASAMAKLGLAPGDVIRLALMSDQARHDWWARLSAGERRAVIAAYPEVIGSGNGLPAEARDEANRILLERDKSDLTAKQLAGTLTEAEKRQLASVEAICRELETIERRTDPITHEPLHAQLYIYDPLAFGGDGRAAIATGNLDDADHVAFMVPGLGTTAAGMTGSRALNVYNESRWAAPGAEVAIVDWVGYDAPSGGLGDDVIGVLNQDMARQGAVLLASDIEGYRVSRGDASPHLTVAGNSYGSTTTAIAADEFGLRADDVILTGSPGAGRADDANDLTTGRDHTWVGAASHDFVTSLGVTGWADPSQVGADVLGRFGVPTNAELMGNDPSEDDFGAHRFQAENVNRLTGTHIDTHNPANSTINDWNVVDHSRYYDPNTESLYNVSAIVTGNYQWVTQAEHRFDPWYEGMQDPERHRTPHEMAHHP